MKLVFAIVNNEDGNLVSRELTKAGFSVTKMASTGGFLRSGNTTLLVGTEEDGVQNAVDIIQAHCMKRKQIVYTPEPYIGIYGGDRTAVPEEIETGGATIFVVDVERFEKL